MVYNLILTFILLSGSVHADQLPWSGTSVSSETVPKTIEDVGIDEKLGSKIDLNLEFKDEANQTVKLGQYFNNKKPVLFAFVYYECPMLCNLLLNGVVELFKKSEKKLGKDFDMVVLSIDPKETPELAQKKKDSYIEELGQNDVGSSWHFLSGTEQNIRALAGQIGFKYKWDEPTKQWAHSAAMYVLSSEGMISRYLYGITFLPNDLKFALLEASQGHTISITDRLLLYCFQYDPTRRTYAFYAYNAMKICAAIMTLLFGLFLAFQLKKMKDENQNTNKGATS